MNKKVMFIIFFIGIMANLHAEAPELRNVMPNSWKKLTKLTTAEEQAFVRENSTVFEETKNYILYEAIDRGDSRKYEHYSIYKQQVGTDTFYRILWTGSAKSDFLSPNIYFYQILIYQGKKLDTIQYFAIVATQNGDLGVFSSLDIIPGKEKAKAILETFVSTAIERNNNNAKVWNIISDKKGQLVGSVQSYYYLMDEAVKMAADKKHFRIEIDASDCLVDPRTPLLYSLQNAFDGDPTTSYVENTEDDLIVISIRGVMDVKQIAIINGYAQDMTLYKQNNRDKIMSILFNLKEFRNLELSDSTLGWQFLNIDKGTGGFSVMEIYHGEKYNDTCIAEYNIYTDQYGWLFGDIDE